MICIIPAKTNSVRCPNKNWRPFAGTNLVQIAVDCAKNAGLTPLVVADSGYRGKMPVAIRPDDLPDDAWAVARWAIDDPNALFVLMQPTSPLRSPEIIRACVAMSCALGARGYDPSLTLWASGAPSGSLYIRRMNACRKIGCMIPDPDAFDINTEADFAEAERRFMERRDNKVTS